MWLTDVLCTFVIVSSRRLLKVYALNNAVSLWIDSFVHVLLDHCWIISFIIRLPRISWAHCNFIHQRHSTHFSTRPVHDNWQFLSTSLITHQSTLNLLLFCELTLNKEKNIWSIAFYHITWGPHVMCRERLFLVLVIHTNHGIDIIGARGDMNCIWRMTHQV